MFDAEKLSAARWSVRDILQYLKNNHRVKRTHVEKAVRCLNEAGFEVSAKMLEAEFRPVFQGKKITTELSSSIQSLYDGVDAAISVRMNDEAHAIISQRREHQKSAANPNTKDQSDGGSVLPSSSLESTTETVDNCDTALACVRLQPYEQKLAFREYLKRQILEWEVWHRSQVDEIRKHESWLDHDKEQLEHSTRQGTGDPDNTYVGSDEWHIDEVASIRENLEFRLVAELEPDCFEEASIAAMVALFWCDINRKNMLVPDYDKQPDFDFLDPYGTFQKYLFEQWEKPIQGRYKHIHWFVEEAIKAYESRIAKNGVDAAISLRMSDIAAAELKPDELPNQNRISDDKATQQGVPSNVETAPLKTAFTTDTETNNSTKQAEADRRSIEKIERSTPKLDTQSMEWIAARKENKEKLGYPTSTLSKYRLESLGGRQLSQYFGIDKDGRRWRRAETMTQGSTVYYYANDLKKYGKKA